MKKARIVLADGYRLVAEGLRGLLEHIHSMRVTKVSLSK